MNRSSGFSERCVLSAGCSCWSCGGSIGFLCAHKEDFFPNSLILLSVYNVKQYRSECVEFRSWDCVWALDFGTTFS